MKYLGDITNEKDMVTKEYVDGGDSDNAGKLAAFPNPNLLDNWYFVGGGSQQGGGKFPINQRSATSYSTANAYTIDRWKLTSGSVTVAAGGITLNGTLVQILENAVGQSVSASVLFSDGTMGVPTYNDSTKTFTLTSTGKTIVAAKLETSGTQTLAHQENGTWVLNEAPNYQQTLARCQRFAVELTPPMFSRANAYIGLGAANSTTQCKIRANLPVPMRASPTISVSGHWQLEYAGSTYGSLTITVDTFMGNAVGLLCKRSSGLTSGRPYMLTYNYAYTDSSMFLSADL